MFFGKKPNSLFKDFLVENEKSRIPVGDAKGKQGIYPFFTSGDAVYRWNDALCDGKFIFLNTGGNADVKFYVGKFAESMFLDVKISCAGRAPFGDHINRTHLYVFGLFGRTCLYVFGLFS